MSNRVDPCLVAGEPGQSRREILVFLTMATVLSWSVMIPIVRGFPADFQPGDIAAVEQAFGSWSMLFGAGPLVAAVVVTAWFRGRPGVAELLKRVVRWRVGTLWYGVALVLPLLPQWLGLWAWATWTGHTPTYPPVAGYLVSWLQIALFSTLYFITEELGWRGFLLPRMLARTHWLKAAVGVGIIWAVWHYPYWLTASWGVTGSVADAVSMAGASTCQAVALSVMLTWIFRHTQGSVLLMMLFHGANNANFDKMFAMAGDASHQGPAFLVIQATSAVFIALVLVAALTIFRARGTGAARSEL